jgi:hypothetical protein
MHANPYRISLNIVGIDSVAQTESHMTLFFLYNKQTRVNANLSKKQRKLVA